MGSEALISASTAEFRDEAVGYVSRINRILLDVEMGAAGEQRATLIEELRRTAHTLKGSAGFTPLTEVVDRASELESLIDLIGEGNDRAAFNGAYEHLDQILTCLDEGGSRTPADAKDVALPLAPGRSGAAGMAVSTNAGEVMAGEESIRVPVRKLDALMGLIGEILVTRVRGEQRRGEIGQVRRQLGELAAVWNDLNRVGRDANRGPNGLLRERKERLDAMLRELVHSSAEISRALERDSMQMTILTESLSEEIKRVRMQPIGYLFETFRRTVRDLALRHGKQISLEVTGQASEVDKKILEELREPLLHLVRNSVDHGIEAPSEREHLGKTPAGTIRLSATTDGHRITVAVSDDGHGIDLDAVRAKALERRLADEGRIATMSEHEVAQFIFAPGLSTRTAVSELSGRGVGLDAVRESVARLQGAVLVRTGGQGTTFEITVPLTLSTSRGLLVEAGGATWALPFSSIERIIRVPRRDIGTIDGHPVVSVDGHAVGVLRLSRILNMSVSGKAERSEKSILVIVRHCERSLAVEVDALVGEQEMVIKSPGPQLQGVRHVAGVALLGTGEVVIVLQPAHLFDEQLDTSVEREQAESVVRRDESILVVEDSLTTRTLEKTILETAGYRVFTARDGVEAMSLLDQEAVDLVISDVNMPRMDGIALVREARKSERLEDLPFILVTSMGSDEDRRGGLEAGANAYIVKTEFDQTAFLAAIRNVIG